MQDFYLYFTLGIEHLTDLAGYDHILFLTVLCGIYEPRDWRKIIFLITAFTVGHSLTLILSVYDKINVPTAWIEFLIPVTIVIAACYNIFQKNKTQGRIYFRYVSTLFFGLIHGMGFSNYLRNFLSPQDGIIGKLLAFNLGLEAGQIIIVTILLIISFLVLHVFKAPKKDWILFLSSAIFGIALIMAIERFPAI
jgi:hypothetical protein